MIDCLTERVITLAEAAKHYCPERRAGRPTHVSCLYRWTGVGCRGVVLESLQVGGTRCTSLEALARFFARLTEAAEAGRSPTHTSAREHSQVEVEKKLDEMGL